MSTNLDLIHRLYAAFGRGDLEFILGNCDPAIEFISNGDPKVIPWGGRKDGVPGAASFFQLLAEYLEFEVFEPREFFEAGNAVIVTGHTRAHVKKHGTFESGWAHIFTLRDGKLTRFQEFYDTAAIAGALAA